MTLYDLDIFSIMAGTLAAYLRRGEGTAIERVFAAARAGDTEVRAMLDERARYMGIALANLVNILNPKLIIVGGMFSQGHDLILPTAEEKMRELAFAGLGEKIEIAPTKFGWQAGVIGAASLYPNCT